MHIPLLHFVSCIGRSQRRLCSQSILQSGQLKQIRLANFFYQSFLHGRLKSKVNHQRSKQLSSGLMILRVECEDHSVPERPGLSKPRVNVDRAGRFSLVVS